MPYRRRYRRARRVRIPYAIPAQTIQRKFRLVSPVRLIGSATATNEYLQINNPIHPLPWTTLYSAGSQPVALDFWLGDVASTGPYAAGVVTSCKTKHSVWSSTGVPFILLNWVDDSYTGTTASTTNGMMGRPGVRYFVVSDGNSDRNPLRWKRHTDITAHWGLFNSADLFETPNAVFARTTQPTAQVYEWIRAVNPASNAFYAGRNDIYAVTTLTFYITMRLRTSSAFDDS